MKHARNLAMSWAILFAHRLRTTLSVLGVLVGVSALIVIVSVGNGTQAELEAMFNTMGTDLLIVRSGKFMQHRGHTHQITRVTTLQESDVAAIAKAHPDILGAAAAISRPMPVQYAATAAQTNVEAIDAAGLRLRNITADSGRLFSDQESGARRAIAVLGPTVATSLFGKTDPVGALVKIGRLPFRVIGVATPRGSDANGSDQDDVVYIPLDTGVKRLFHATYVETIYVKAATVEALDGVEAAVRPVLRKRHRLTEKREDDFTLQNQKALMEAALDTSRSTTRLVAGVGGISLVVAGIGILAVMLMSVRERRWEIGLRRAVGARRLDILLQFLFEAALLALAGAGAGILMGLAGVVLTNHMGWARADFSVEAAMLASSVSVAIGILFGAYPAHRASLLEPIVALHSPE
jgi:putative ABC transport system permease protein